MNIVKPSVRVYTCFVTFETHRVVHVSVDSSLFRFGKTHNGITKWEIYIYSREKHQINHGTKNVKAIEITTKTVNLTGYRNVTTDHKGSCSSYTVWHTPFFGTQSIRDKFVPILTITSNQVTIT